MNSEPSLFGECRKTVDLLQEIYENLPEVDKTTKY